MFPSHVGWNCVIPKLFLLVLKSGAHIRRKKNPHTDFVTEIHCSDSALLTPLALHDVPTVLHTEEQGAT